MTIERLYDPVMEWHEPIYLPAHAVHDPRLRSRHLSLLLAIHYLARTADGPEEIGFRATNSEVMRLARIKDRETFYGYRGDLHRVGCITHLPLPGEPAYYELPDRVDVMIPSGVLTDWRITTAGAIALYVALSTLAEDVIRATHGWDDRPMYGNLCTVHNGDLMTLCQFSTRRQLTRYRGELMDFELLEVVSHLGLPPVYTLPLNTAANAVYETSDVT